MYENTNEMIAGEDDHMETLIGKLETVLNLMEKGAKNFGRQKKWWTILRRNQRHSHGESKLLMQ